MIAASTLLSTVAASAAWDGAIDPVGRVGFGNASGGAFRNEALNGLQNKIKVGYSIPGATLTPGPLAPNQFISFCLEKRETLDFGDDTDNIPDYIYNVKISDAAKKGGNNASEGSVGNPAQDPISKATAWLFFNFVNGTLDDADTTGTFKYVGTSNEKNADGNDLQQAIWFLEQENSTSKNYLVDLAVKSLYGPAGTVAQARSENASGYLGVRVLNLYEGSNESTATLRQDQLVVVPEPSTYIAGGLALLPLLFGLRTRLGKK